MNWISVKDSLPSDDNLTCSYNIVLVCAINPTTNMNLKDPIFAFANWDGDKWVIYNDVGVFDCSGEAEIISEEITHWTPLIFPPIKKNLSPICFRCGSISKEFKNYYGDDVPDSTKPCIGCHDRIMYEINLYLDKQLFTPNRWLCSEEKDGITCYDTFKHWYLKNILCLL